MPHHSTHTTVDVWSITGTFRQLIFSPKGAIEGFLIDTDGTPTQFVVDVHDLVTSTQLLAIRPGQALVVEGIEADPSPKGEAEHTVYDFERLVGIDGEPVEERLDAEGSVGTVVRYNYAKHGAANGVVLDNGDFIHTRPDGFEQLNLKIGDEVNAKGTAHPLADGSGLVIEARTVNGRTVGRPQG